MNSCHQSSPADHRHHPHSGLTALFLEYQAANNSFNHEPVTTQDSMPRKSKHSLCYMRDYKVPVYAQYHTSTKECEKNNWLINNQYV